MARTAWHYQVMSLSALPVGEDTASGQGAKAGQSAPTSAHDAQTRLRSMVNEHYVFVWRLLRWLGVQRSEIDDIAQEVFWIAAQRLGDIHNGSERAFLYGVATRKAAASRRSAKARVDTQESGNDELAATECLPDEAIDETRARALLRKIIRSMPQDLQSVFVLFELEEIEIPDIASMLGIPIGTVGSRLRRARKVFSQQASRIRAKAAHAGRGDIDPCDV